MRSLMLVAAAITLLSCSRPAMPPGAALAEAIAGRVAGNPEICVSTFPSENLHALDRATLAYGHGRAIYINRLGGECPGLSPYNTIIIDAEGSQYCRGDRIRGLEPGAIIPGPTCILGDWVPYRLP